MPQLFATTRSEAVFSDDGLYRFWLCKEWGVANKFGAFLMQNPSRADALRGDDTATRCNNLAVQWGWRGFGIVNLNPYVDPNPLTATKPVPAAIQDENDVWIKRVYRLADVFVLATGGGWRKITMDTLRRLGLESGFSMIEKNNDDSFLHPRGITDTAKYPCPKTLI